MPRAPHAKHRWRIASRCTACGVAVLYACGYRTCAATLVSRRGSKSARGCTVDIHQTRKRANASDTASIDLVKEARRIFRDDLAPAREIGL